MTDDMPTLTPAQLAQVAIHHKAMTEAVHAAHATTDAAEKITHWITYRQHEAEVNKVIPPSTEPLKRP